MFDAGLELSSKEGFKSVDNDWKYNAVSGRMVIYIVEEDGEMVISAEYQAKAYDDGSILRFLEMFRHHLRRIVLEGIEESEQSRTETPD